MVRKPTAPTSALDLTRRERQVMDIVYRHGTVTAADVHGELGATPSYSGVRTILRVLVDKKILDATDSGGRLVYRPVQRTARVRQAALTSLVRTFFDGSAEKAMLALVESSQAKFDARTANELRRLIDRAERSARPEDDGE